MIKLKTLTAEIVDMVLRPDCRIDRWEKLRHILLLRLNKKHTLDDVAGIFGFSRERARQYQALGLKAINRFLGNKDIKLVEESERYHVYVLDGGEYAIYDTITKDLDRSLGIKELVYKEYEDLVKVYEKEKLNKKESEDTLNTDRDEAL